MKLGVNTDSLRELTFEQALDHAVELGLDAVEINTGNFSTAPHCDLARLVESQSARDGFLGAIRERGLILSALNCSGNLLDPHPERRQRSQATFRDTVRLAAQLGLDTVVTMSGCPGSPDGGTYPNWITCTWQREYTEAGERQWKEEIEPFWREAGPWAADQGIRLAIEMHHGQSVYNTRTLVRLREIAGEGLGANLDPSHLWPQGMDPLVVIKALQGAIWHVHAKDTRIDPQEAALNGLLETRDMPRAYERSWAFRAVGYGHDALWWRDFVSSLRAAGFDGVLSLEHEDRWMGSQEGLAKGVQFLKPLLLQTEAEPWI